MYLHNKLFIATLSLLFTLSINAGAAIVKITHTKGQNNYTHLTISYDEKGNIANTVCTRQDGYVFTHEYSYLPEQQLIRMTETINGPENENFTIDVALQNGLISSYSVDFDGESYILSTFSYNSERHITKAIDYSDEDETIIEYFWQDNDLVSHRESWEGQAQWWNDFTYSTIPSEPLLASFALFSDNLEDNFIGLVPFSGMTPAHMPSMREERGSDGNHQYEYSYVRNHSGQITEIVILKDGHSSESYTIEWADLAFDAIKATQVAKVRDSQYYHIGGYKSKKQGRGIHISAGRKWLNRFK